MLREGAVSEQLGLFSQNLPPLRLRQKVRVIAEGWDGEIVQVWPGRDHFAVFSWTWRGPITAGLPVYRRDELELLEDEL